MEIRGIIIGFRPNKTGRNYSSYSDIMTVRDTDLDKVFEIYFNPKVVSLDEVSVIRMVKIDAEEENGKLVLKTIKNV